MEDASKLRLLFRVSCCLINVVGLSYHCLYMDFEAYKVFGGRFKFLTFLNMILQSLYFVSSAAVELLAFTRKHKNVKLSWICDMLFASLAFPIGLTVCVLFWGLYLNDPNSCQSEEAVRVIPRWLNHYMHSFPALEVLFEVLLFKHIYPRKSSGILAVLLAGASYMIWVFFIAYHSDFWVYPFLEKMSLRQIHLFFAGSGVLLVVLYLLGEALAKTCHIMERSKKNTDKIY